MRKVTVILIAAIYVASIVIVGVFGLKALPYDEFVYIEDIVFNEINDTPVVERGKDDFYVILAYKKDLIVILDYTPKPANATKGREINVNIVSPDNHAEIATLTFQTGSGWQLHFLQPGTVRIAFEATDGSSVRKELTVMVR